MVATSNPDAALAGLRALEAGGNACDAALAAAGVLVVTEPYQCAPGGDLFAIVVRDGAAPIGLNASGRAPAEPGGAQRDGARVRRRMDRPGGAVLTAWAGGRARARDRARQGRLRDPAQSGRALA